MSEQPLPKPQAEGIRARLTEIRKVPERVKALTKKGLQWIQDRRQKIPDKPREVLKEIGVVPKLEVDLVTTPEIPIADVESNEQGEAGKTPVADMQNRDGKGNYLTNFQFDVPKRYADSKLVIDKSARIKHIVRQEENRDIFGNRIFTSADKAYQDREGDNVKAGLLISPEGESFVRTNPGILTNIDKGLVELEYTLEKDTFKRKTQVDLGEGRKMTYLTAHGQSSVYLLEVGKEKYIVKTKNYASGETFATAAQPYINEMLQTQTLAHSLKNKLAEINISLPTYMFASGQISCMKFEEGNKPEMQEYRESFEKLRQLSSDYILQQQNNDVDLWKNMAVDLDLRTDVTRNFKKRSDGSLVWIDPFLYDAFLNEPAENWLEKTHGNTFLK